MVQVCSEEPEAGLEVSDLALIFRRGVSRQLLVELEQLASESELSHDLVAGVKLA